MLAIDLPDSVPTWAMVTATGIAALGGLMLRLRKQTDSHDLSVGKAFGDRLQKVESDLERCRQDHQKCNERVRALEVSEVARQQNDSLYQQILTEVRTMAQEAITGRRAALDELKNHIGQKQQPPLS